MTAHAIFTKNLKPFFYRKKKKLRLLGYLELTKDTI